MNRNQMLKRSVEVCKFLKVSLEANVNYRV